MDYPLYGIRQRVGQLHHFGKNLNRKVIADLRSLELGFPLPDPVVQLLHPVTAPLAEARTGINKVVDFAKMQNAPSIIKIASKKVRGTGTEYKFTSKIVDPIDVFLNETLSPIPASPVLAEGPNTHLCRPALKSQM